MEQPPGPDKFKTCLCFFNGNTMLQMQNVIDCKIAEFCF